MSSLLPSEEIDKDFPKPLKTSFDDTNVARNIQLQKSFSNLPQARKTGTTIAGCVFEGGVVLAADTRASSNGVIDKNCAKIHRITEEIRVLGAGTAADCFCLARRISSQLALHSLENGGKKPRVITAVTLTKRMLFEHQGKLECALIMGGVDATGSFLHSIAPHGSTDSLSYATHGSGSYAAMSVLESRYKDNLTEQEAMAICCDAILAGIFNDLGSGSNVDLCVIRKSDTSYLRGYRTPNQVEPLRAQIRLPAPAFNFPIGSTPYIKERIEIFEQPPVVVAGDNNQMEVEG